MLLDLLDGFRPVERAAVAYRLGDGAVRVNGRRRRTVHAGARRAHCQE